MLSLQPTAAGNTWMSCTDRLAQSIDHDLSLQHLNVMHRRAYTQTRLERNQHAVDLLASQLQSCVQIHTHHDLITASSSLQHLDVAATRADDLPNLVRVNVEPPDSRGILGQLLGGRGVT